MVSLLPLALTICAGVALAVHVASLALLLYGRSAWIDTRVFVRQIEKLLAADNATRAVKLCGALEPASPARRLTLFVLGLELPAATLTADSASDYRAAAPVARFEDVALEAVAQESARLEATLRPYVIAAIGSGVVAAVAAGAGRLLGTQELHVATAVIGGAGALGTIFGFSSTRKVYASLRVIRDSVLPLLQPVEEMSSDRKEAAVAARERLAAPDTRPRVRVTLGLVIVVAAAVAGAVAYLGSQADDSSTTADTTVAPTDHARVVGTSGRAPVGQGTLCTIGIETHDSQFNCRIQVRCAGTGLYGTTSGMGFTSCLWDGDVAMSALDTRYDEGDPALRFDRRTRFVEVRDATWTVTLELVAASPSTGATTTDAGY